MSYATVCWGNFGSSKPSFKGQSLEQINIHIEGNFGISIIKYLPHNPNHIIGIHLEMWTKNKHKYRIKQRRLTDMCRESMSVKEW